MEKRAVERIPTNIKVRFHYNNANHSGTIINLSEKGMFISTKKIYLPFEMQFKISIPLNEKILRVQVNLSRIIMSPDSCDGLGVELQSPPKDYLEFVRNLN